MRKARFGCVITLASVAQSSGLLLSTLSKMTLSGADRSAAAIAFSVSSLLSERDRVMGARPRIEAASTSARSDLPTPSRGAVMSMSGAEKKSY